MKKICFLILFVMFVVMFANVSFADGDEYFEYEVETPSMYSDKFGANVGAGDIKSLKDFYSMLMLGGTNITQEDKELLKGFMVSLCVNELGGEAEAYKLCGCASDIVISKIQSGTLLQIAIMDEPLQHPVVRETFGEVAKVCFSNDMKQVFRQKMVDVIYKSCVKSDDDPDKIKFCSCASNNVFDEFSIEDFVDIGIALSGKENEKEIENKYMGRVMPVVLGCLRQNEGLKNNVFVGCMNKNIYINGTNTNFTDKNKYCRCVSDFVVSNLNGNSVKFEFKDDFYSVLDKLKQYGEVSCMQQFF